MKERMCVICREWFVQHAGDKQSRKCKRCREAEKK